MGRRSLPRDAPDKLEQANLTVGCDKRRLAYEVRRSRPQRREHPGTDEWEAVARF